MRSNLVKISSQKISETLKISLPQFNLLNWYELPWQYIKYVEIPVLVACQWSRMLTWFPIICISHFFLSAVFYMQWLRSCTDLITCEAELHGSVTRMVSSILSLVGAYTAWWQLYKNWTETVFSWPSSTATTVLSADSWQTTQIIALFSQQNSHLQFVRPMFSQQNSNLLFFRA